MIRMTSAVLLASLSGAFAWAEEPVYSSLCWSPAGDAAGYRIKLMHDSLFIEWSEGPLYQSQTTSLSIHPDQSFEATFPAPTDEPITYAVRGRMTPEAITLESWDWGDGHGPHPSNAVIPRREGKPEEIKDCSLRLR